MKQFFKTVFATIVGFLLVGCACSLLLFIFIGVAAVSSEKKPVVEEGTVLHIKLEGSLVERAEPDAFAELGLSDATPGAAKSLGLDNLLTAIRVAKSNEKIKGIYLECGTFSADPAGRQAIRRALLDFRKSKKFVLAYADQYLLGTYHIASAADRVLLNPSGMLEWTGLSAHPMFYTDLLKKAGVKMQVFKVGTFKSAVEPYILTEMSEANRAQVTSYLTDIWSGITADVSATRRIGTDSLNAAADRYLTFEEPSEYVRLGLVDSLSYIDGVRDKLRSLAHVEKVRLVTPDELARIDEPKASANVIAVYYAEGEIVDQAMPFSPLSGGGQQIVGQKVVEDLDRLAADEDVKAVVLRVNSPGGSAYASEQMWRAVQLLKKKKPVVVSMGGLAASGGYYLSCGADYIFAEPATLTGSIGIFGLVPDASELLTEKLGLHFDVVKTNKSADFTAITRPFTAEEAEAMQQYVNRGYRQFVGRVAAGRHMTADQVDAIGQGRVWTGNQALRNHLVDRFGSLDDAIAEAARRAKVGDDYSLLAAPAQQSFFDQLMNKTVRRDYLEEKLQATLGEYYAPLCFLRSIGGTNVLQARMFYVPGVR